MKQDRVQETSQHLQVNAKRHLEKMVQQLEQESELNKTIREKIRAL